MLLLAVEVVVVGVVVVEGHDAASVTGVVLQAGGVSWTIFCPKKNALSTNFLLLFICKHVLCMLLTLLGWYIQSKT